MNEPSYYSVVGFSQDVTPTQTADHIPEPDLSGSALFLDFDGTLVDIAETPGGIVVPGELPDILSRLCRETGGATAIVSGRPIHDIRSFLPEFPGPVIGCHGAEEERDGEIVCHPLTGSELVDNVVRLATRFAATVDGLDAEPKPVGVVLHFRKAPLAGNAALNFLRSLSECIPEFELHCAKMAYELRPIGVSKGVAVERWLDRAPFKGRRPVYIGDDLTDEPALALVRDRSGLSIKVGDDNTAADYCVPKKNVLPLLKRWLSERA